jgi:hypothetical protein
MASKLFLTLSAFVLIFAWSCKFDNKEEKTTKKDQVAAIVFKPVSIHKSFGNCENSDSLCYKIDIQLLKINEGPENVKSAVNKSMEEYIAHELNGFLSDEKSQTNTDVLIRELFDEYKNLARDMEDFHQTWEIKISTKVLYQDDHVISIQGSNENYMGGAHGNHWKNILNFDTKTGKNLSQKDIITNQPEFLKVAESWFRKTREIPAGADLEKEGYLFTNNQFKLPENIGFTENGLLLVYNPYEAGPYSMGEIKYTIPINEVKDFIKE